MSRCEPQLGGVTSAPATRSIYRDAGVDLVGEDAAAGGRVPPRVERETGAGGKTVRVLGYAREEQTGTTRRCVYR